MTAPHTTDDGHYNGDVSPDGPAQSRSLGSVTLYKLAVGDFGNNAYLLVDNATRDAILVDAAADWPRISKLIDEAGAKVARIATTHRHHDHTGALVEAVQATGAATGAGRPDADDLPVPTVHPLDHGDRITLGDKTIDIIAIAGHTPGSIVLALQDDDGVSHLLTGDTLFPGGVGATDRYDYQSFDTLYAQVVERIFDRFDDSTWVYPGHGGDTTLGAERGQLGEWKERGW